MSTLGTFANFAKLQQAPKRPDRNIGQALVDRAKGDTELLNPNVQKAIATQSKTIGRKESEAADQAFKTAKKIRNRNLLIGAGLGAAGLGTAGAIALNNRRKKKTADMGFNSAFANFAEATRKIGKGDKAVEYTMDELANIKKSSKATQGQKAIERATDTGSTMPKAGVVSRTLALAGSPERDLIRSGKGSKNEMVRNISKGAESFGRLGFKQGATGARGVLNKVVGRTATGKVARLGAAGLGLSAIGGAMRKNRQENQ
jgi:hypothetical protein